MSTNTGVVCIALNALLLDKNNSELFSAEVAVGFLQNSSSAGKTNAENSLVCFLSLLHPVRGVLTTEPHSVRTRCNDAALKYKWPVFVLLSETLTAVQVGVWLRTAATAKTFEM